MTFRNLCIPLFILALAVPGYADVIFTLGNSPQPKEENILFGVPQTGTLVTGQTNSTNALVDFTSATDTLNVTASGQAKVTAVDGWINELTIHVRGGTYLDFILNPFSGGTATGLASVTVYANDSVSTFDYALGTGSNFLTITTAANEWIDRTTITSANGFQSLLQPRVSGASVAVVPEPATLPLLGTGFIVMGLVLRRLR